MVEKSRDPRTGRYLNQGGFSTPPPGAPHEVSSPLSISEQDIEAARARALARVEQRLAEAQRGGQTSLVESPRETGPQGAGGAESADERTPPSLDAQARG